MSREAEEIVWKFATSPLSPVYEQAGRELSRHMRKRSAAGDQVFPKPTAPSNPHLDMYSDAYDSYAVAEAADQGQGGTIAEVPRRHGKPSLAIEKSGDPVTRELGGYYDDEMSSVTAYVPWGGHISGSRGPMMHELTHAHDPEPPDPLERARAMRPPRPLWWMSDPTEALAVDSNIPSHADPYGGTAQERLERLHEQDPLRRYRMIFGEQRADEGALVGEIVDDWLKSDQSQDPAEFAERWIRQNAGKSGGTVQYWLRGLTHTDPDEAARRVSQLAATVAMRRTNRPRFQRRAHSDELRMPKDDVWGDPAWEMSLSAESVVRHFSLQ